jgi:hypothetical protein
VRLDLSANVSMNVSSCGLADTQRTLYESRSEPGEFSAITHEPIASPAHLSRRSHGASTGVYARDH